MQVIKSTSNNQNLFLTPASQDLFANAISIEELEPRLELADKGPNYGVLLQINQPVPCSGTARP